MLVIQRKNNKTRKRFLLYLLFLLISGLLIASYYLINFFSRPLFVNPLVNDSNQSLVLEKKLNDAKMPYSSISYSSDSSLIITLAQGGKIIISSEKKIDQQISSLQRILRELTIKGKTFKSIDFRFEKPVVEFN